MRQQKKELFKSFQALEETKREHTQVCRSSEEKEKKISEMFVSHETLVKKLQEEKQSLLITNQELKNQVEISRSEHKKLLDEHSHQLKNSAEQLKRLNDTKKS